MNIMQNTPPNVEYKCKVCGAMFKTEKELRDHEKTHVPKQVPVTPGGQKVPQKNRGRITLTS